MKAKEFIRKRKIVIIACCMAVFVSGACIHAALQPDTVRAEKMTETGRQETEAERKERAAEIEQSAETAEIKQTSAKEKIYVSSESESGRAEETASQKSREDKTGSADKPPKETAETKPPHEHSWEQVMGTKETEEKVPIIGDKCNTCNETITGFAEKHILESDCMGYNTDVIVGYEYKKVSKPVVTGYRCSCGAAK